MRINADLATTTIVEAQKLDWVASPAAGVDRRMLYRAGEEVARATSIVRYAPGSAFPRHTHSGGEEILVLEGTFQDETGDFPAGAYFRNPPGTGHAPAAKDGCTIFVRLWQYREGDDQQIVCQPGQGLAAQPGTGADEALVLFDDGHEQVRLETFGGGARIRIENTRGLELLVTRGSVTFGGRKLDSHSWIRLPSGTMFEAMAGTEGAKIWLKDAPLVHSDVLELP